MHSGEDDDEFDGTGLTDNGDPKNPPNPTPGALKPIDPSQLPSGKDLGGS